MEDEEFAENIEAYRAELSLGVPDAGKAGNIMAILCDNAYRRIKDDTCPAHIKLNIDKTGNLTRIPKVQLEAGRYIPQTVVCGEFSIIAQTGPAPVYRPTILIEHSDFVGKYLCFVAAAIGDDKDSIERIYGDAFLDISDLHTLPVTLTNVVKRFIRT